MWQYPDPVQSGAAAIPGKTIPAHFSWTSGLGQGKARRGVTWVGDVWPERSPASPLRRRSRSRMLASSGSSPGSFPGRGRYHMAPRPGYSSQTCCLLWVGLLQSHALPEGTGSQIKVLLSQEPSGWSLGRILSRGPCGSSWDGRWSGCAVAPEIYNNRVCSPSSKHVNQLKSI